MLLLQTWNEHFWVREFHTRKEPSSFFTSPTLIFSTPPAQQQLHSNSNIPYRHHLILFLIQHPNLSFFRIVFNNNSTPLNSTYYSILLFFPFWISGSGATIDSPPHPCLTVTVTITIRHSCTLLTQLGSFPSPSSFPLNFSHTQTKLI